ncbi:MAG: DUF4465 domain-containing protein [Algibacter sp.]
MKFIQKYISIIAAIIGLVLFSACEEDELDLRIPYPNDITFNELTLDRFTYEIPTAPFTAGDDKSGMITVNVTSTGGSDYSGFALSNKNFRSYPWDLSPDFAPAGGLTPDEVQESINTTAFSVYTPLMGVNRTENFLVGNTTGDNAYFTLSEPGIVEHVLVANTSYNLLLNRFGSILSDDLDRGTQQFLLDGGETLNPGIINEDPSLFGVFTLPGVDGSLNTIRLFGTEILAKEKAGIAAGDAALAAFINSNPGSTIGEQEGAFYDAFFDAFDNTHTGYVKLIIEGSLGGSTTGAVEIYLAVLEGVDAENPEWDFILDDWRKVDLTSLGNVDKVLFKMSSSYVDALGNMVYPPLFCLDGIRLQ